MTPPPIAFDPALVEEAVLQAEGSLGRDDRRRFRRERDLLYTSGEEHDRAETRFRELHHAWFTRLRLDTEIVRFVRELPPRYSRCVVARAIESRNEGADLHVDRGGPEGAPPALVIRLMPATLLAPGRLAPLLRHELMHVADMLDPGFGYLAEPPVVDGGAMHETLVRERYRVAWNASVDGRLAAAGHLPAGAREARRGEFLAAFSTLAGEAEATFETIFDGPRPTHAWLWDLASKSSASGLCPLCRSPHPSLRSAIAGIAPGTAAAVRREFPAWSPEAGLCPQCEDLYASRAVHLLT